MKKQREAIRVNAGDFVEGHDALYADVMLGDKRVCVRGKIKSVSPSGKTVQFECELGWVAFGLPRVSTWTWRNKKEGYFQKGSSPKKFDMGLLLLTS